MRLRTKLMAGLLIATTPTIPLQAQGLNDLLSGGKLDIGRVLVGLLGEVISGLVFNNAKDATPKGTCQPKSDAESLVNGQVYGAGSQANGYVCNGVKINGLSGESEHAQFAEQLERQMNAAEGTDGTGSFTINGKNGRPKEVAYSWRDDGYSVEETAILVVDGVRLPETQTEFAEQPFYRVDVKSSLNLRAGADTKTSPTGSYNGGDIVRVLSYTKAEVGKCKSGNWAMVTALGAGVGYVCADYLIDAPAGTTLADVSPFKKPSKGGFAQGQGNVTYSQKTVAARMKKKVIRTNTYETKKNGERKRARTADISMANYSSRMSITKIGG